MTSSGGEKRPPAWAQRKEALRRDGIVSPDVFHPMVDRWRDLVVPYPHALAAEVGGRPVPLSLQGLLSHVDRQNAAPLAAVVDVERQVLQAFIGTAPWDHRPLIQGLVGQGGDQVGEPDGLSAFDPRSFPKRGTPSVGGKRQGCGHRGKGDNCQGGVFMGYVSAQDQALLAFRLSLPEEGTRDKPRRQECHVPLE